MALTEPPGPAVLRRLRGRSLAGATLHRVFRAERASPWWFSSRRAPDGRGGRFDLPPPDGSCYTATSLAGAVLEAFREHSRGVLPDVELQARRRAECTAPALAPAAAVLNAAAARSAGVTAALWAGSDRALTQRWAAALHRAGWLAISHGVQHDPTGRLRAVTLFDVAGPHDPYDDPGWAPTIVDVHGDGDVAAVLARHGYTVTRSDPQLPVVALATAVPRPARRGATRRRGSAR